MLRTTQSRFSCVPLLIATLLSACVVTGGEGEPEPEPLVPLFGIFRLWRESGAEVPLVINALGTRSFTYDDGSIAVLFSEQRILLRMAGDGTIRWVRDYSSTLPSFLWGAVDKAPGGDILFAFHSSDIGGDTVVTRISGENGDVLEAQRWDGNGPQIIARDDGYVVVTNDGRMRLYQAGAVAFDINVTGTMGSVAALREIGGDFYAMGGSGGSKLARIDATGALIWVRDISIGENMLLGAAGIGETDDGDVLLVVSMDTYFIPIAGAAWASLVVSRDGALRDHFGYLTKEIGGIWYNFAQGAQLISDDGGFIVFGRSNNGVNADFVNTGVALSLKGEPLWTAGGLHQAVVPLGDALVVGFRPDSAYIRYETLNAGCGIGEYDLGTGDLPDVVVAASTGTLETLTPVAPTPSSDVVSTVLTVEIIEEPPICVADGQ